MSTQSFPFSAGFRHNKNNLAAVTVHKPAERNPGRDFARKKSKRSRLRCPRRKWGITDGQRIDAHRAATFFGEAVDTDAAKAYGVGTNGFDANGFGGDGFCADAREVFGADAVRMSALSSAVLRAVVLRA